MEILLVILAFFAMIGLMDDLLANRIGVADHFTQGIASMGSLAIPGEYMPAYIVNKLVSGIVAAAVALRLVKPEAESVQLVSLRTEAETV